jgi:copper chaperone CopZ
MKPSLYIIIALLCACLLAAPTRAYAQFLSATVRVDGLTCSLCHLGVHKAVKKLSFVEEAAPNIDETSLDLTFKKGSSVSFDQLAQAISNAGFSIGSLKVKFYFQNVRVGADEHFRHKGVLYHIVNAKEGVLNGVTEMTIIDKAFVAKEDFERWSNTIKHECYKTGKAQDCCSVGKSSNDKESFTSTRVYHITL